MTARLQHLPAGALNAQHIGTRLTVTDAHGLTFAGGLSDLFQSERYGRTVLWLGGHRMVDVRQDTTVTTGDLDLPGGHP